MKYAQKSKARRHRPEDTEETTTPVQRADTSGDVLGKIDDVLEDELDLELLSEIEDVLEEDAEQFLADYVQKGGE